MISPTNQSRRRFLRRAAAALGAAVALPQLGFPCRASAADKRSKWKFAICNETFPDWPFPKAFAFAAECGYQGLEVAPFTISNFVTDISAAKRAEVCRQAEQAGLEVIGLHWLLAKTEGFHLTSPDSEVRKRTAQYLRELAAFSADLGGKILVFGSPKQRDLAKGVTRTDGMKYATEVFQSIMPAMEKLGQVLAIEPLGPTDTNFITTAADGAELVERVASPHCRLHLDCKAMATEPTPIPELIRRHHGMLAHFHANDANRQGPGFGKLDFVPIFRAMDEVGYQGWVSVEVFDYTPGPERLARESIRYMQACVAKLAE